MRRGRRLWLALIGAVAVFTAASPGSAHEAHRREAAARQAAAAQAAAQAPGSAGHTMPTAGHDHRGAVADMAMGDAAQLTPAERRARMGVLERTSDWLGRWHTLVVHFPIALLLVALLLEVWAMIRRKEVVASATRVLIAFGALGAVAAAGLGWLAMGFDITQDDFIHRSHRIVGTAIPLLALTTWWARERFAAAESRRGRTGYRVLLLLTGGAVAANGFLGGSMGPEGLYHLAW